MPRQRSNRDGPRFDVSAIEALTDARSWQRGVDYFERGAVATLTIKGGKARAVVEGHDDYRVRLSCDGDAFVGSCDCPVGQDGRFCKHCVAAALAWLEREDGRPEEHLVGEAEDTIDTPVGLDSSGQPSEADRLHDFLGSLDKAELVELIEERLPWDDAWRERLLLWATRDTGEDGGVDISAYRESIKRATRVRGGYIDYDGSGSFADGVDNVADALEGLLHDGHAAAVIPLLEYGVKRIEKALLHADDSNGEISGVMHRLAQLHADACHLAPPDPVKLAQRLFKAEVEGEFDAFHNAALTYADVLGEAGLAEFRRLAKAQWDELPPRRPGDERFAFDTRRLCITSIMESLARAADDVDGLIDVLRHDLALPHGYLRIAETLVEAGREHEALSWAREGLAAFPADRDTRLENFAASLLLSRGEHDEAMAMIWSQFERHPGAETYLHLKNHAKRARQWRHWHKRAYALVREALDRATANPDGRAPSTFDRWADRSLLVEMCLLDGHADRAWREAQVGGCSDRLWMQLAKAREKKHPADAVAVYQERIDPIVSQTSNRAYEQAASLLRHIGKLMDSLDQREAYRDYLAQLRETYKRKRNFVAILDKFE